MAAKPTTAIQGAAPQSARPPQGRKNEILDLAAALFADNGIDKTTVREIGQAAGMLSGSLYHYFDSKETIVAEVITGYLEKRVTDCREVLATHTDPQDRLRALLRSELLDIAESNAARVVNTQSRYVLSMLPTYTHMHDLAAEVRQIWLDTIQSGVDQGVFRHDVDPEIFYALARKTSSVAQQWVDGLLWPAGPHSLTTKFGAELVADSWISLLLSGFCDVKAVDPLRAGAKASAAGGNGAKTAAVTKPRAASRSRAT
jgi:AcrR family transcriptional regulator